MALMYLHSLRPTLAPTVIVCSLSRKQTFQWSQLEQYQTNALATELFVECI